MVRTRFLVAGAAASLLLYLTGSSIWAQVSRTPQTDPVLVEQGKVRFTSDCAKCHGADARGTTQAPDLLRSVVVLHDRGQALNGSNYAEVLKSGPHHFDYDPATLRQISQFLIFSINGTLRSGPNNRPSNLLSGDAKAGAAYFQKNCSSCHSVTGDMAGIGTRFDPAALQQRFVFPNRIIGGAAKRPEVTVTPPSGPAVKGNLVRLDDFTVTLRLPSGSLTSFDRGPGMKVDVVDPLGGHYALLDRYTNEDIHNMTTYLETLK